MALHDPVIPAENGLEANARPHCKNAGACRAKTPGKHCSPCNLSALHKDPAFRAKRREAFAAKIRNDPEFRAKHVAASAARLERWRNSPECQIGRNEISLANLAKANTPEGLAKRKHTIRQTRLAGIPEHRWDEYMALARRMPAADAKRMILEDERIQARRTVQRIAEEMRLKHEREKAQAY